MNQEQINKTFKLLRFYWKKSWKNDLHWQYYRSASKVASFFLGESQIELWQSQEYKIKPE